MARPKDVLTTGEVAKICNVAPRTVSKWFDTGKLRGYRIPGSKDRRIPLPQLIRFMQAHGIPLNGLDTGVTRILMIAADRNESDLLADALKRDGGYEVTIAQSAFHAGMLAEAVRPQVILIDVEVPGMNSRAGVRSIKDAPDMGTCRLIAITRTARPGEAEALRQEGFDDVLTRPFDASMAVRVIENAPPSGAQLQSH